MHLKVLELAASQHACVTLSQCLELGMSRSAVQRMTSSGLLAIDGPGVYRVSGAPMTWNSRTMAAVLAAQPDALASHRTAAHLWGLEGFGPTGRVEITVPLHRRPRRRSGVVVHESSAWELREGTTRWGIPVCGAARTLVDLAAVEDEEMELQRALDEIRRKGLATWSELWETFVLHARRGRPGVVMCRSVLELRFGRTVPDTEFARLFMRLLEDAGLPTPVAEHWVVVEGRRYRVDLAYVDIRIAIELDGKETHLTDAAFESDRVRDNQLGLVGWTVRHYTWRRFIDAPQEIVAEIRSFVRLARIPGQTNERTG